MTNLWAEHLILQMHNKEHFLRTYYISSTVLDRHYIREPCIVTANLDTASKSLKKTVGGHRASKHLHSTPHSSLTSVLIPKLCHLSCNILFLKMSNVMPFHFLLRSIFGNPSKDQDMVMVSHSVQSLLVFLSSVEEDNITSNPLNYELLYL